MRGKLCRDTGVQDTDENEKRQMQLNHSKENPGFSDGPSMIVNEITDSCKKSDRQAGPRFERYTMGNTGLRRSCLAGSVGGRPSILLRSNSGHALLLPHSRSGDGLLPQEDEDDTPRASATLFDWYVSISPVSRYVLVATFQLHLPTRIASQSYSGGVRHRCGLHQVSSPSPFDVVRLLLCPLVDAMQGSTST